MKNNGETSKKIESIHLFVSLPTNDVCSLRDVSTAILVHQVKSKIELRVGIPGDLIHLYFMNNELADDKTLQDYKLKHGCILRVRLHKTWLGLFIACSKGDSYEVFQNGVQAMNESSEDFDVTLWNKLVIKRATFALFMATYHGYLSLMLDLLNTSAADINGCTVFGRTSLHIAAFQGFVGCVSLLLSEGAISSALDVFGKTPLQLAYVNRHTYCQKRLYMHQVSRNEEMQESRTNRPKTAPHKMVKNFQENQRRRKNISFDATKAVLRPKSTGSLPSVASSSKDPLIPPLNHTVPSPSYDLPVMEIIEPLGEHSEDKVPSPLYSSPVPCTQTAPVGRENSGKSTQCSTSRGIRGIDAILRTSQDDIVGEYHNIEDSIADINVTTLTISLPGQENTSTGFETKQPKFNASDSCYDLIEKRVQSPPRKKMLGFILRAEENRNISQERKSNGRCTESGKQDDKESTSASCDTTKSEEQDARVEKLWTPTNDGYPEQQDDRMWTPVAYDNLFNNSGTTKQHEELAQSLSYDEWLEKKRRTAKETKNERPESAVKVRSKHGREMDVAAFQNWLEEKKKFRRRSSKPETSLEHHRVSSGVAFDEWLRQKRQVGESCKTMPDHESQVVMQQRPKTASLGGKTFAEWLAEKKQPRQIEGIDIDTKQKRNRSHSGKTFREWLKDKNREKQNEADLKENLTILELQEKALLEEERRLNPRVKTFEQWFEEKRSQSVIELIQSKNTPVESELLNSKIKFPEDACLVFDMWLTSKNMEDLRKEERLYEEMVEKWRRKEQERLQVRRSILSKLSQVRKYT